MNFKKLLLISVVWTVVAAGLGMFGVSYILSHPIRGVSSDARSAELGRGVSVIITIGYAFIWIPAAYRYGQKRRDAQARKARGKRRH